MMYAKRKVAEAALSESLIPKPDNNEENEGDDDERPKKTLGTIVTTAAVCLLGAAGFAASAAAMVSVQTLMVFVAGGICCINAPSLVHRQYNINKSPNIRSSINKLRDTMKELENAIDFLKNTIDTLENEVDDVKVIEHELGLIADEQGANVSEFVQLVKENEEILKQMQHNLREVFVAELARIILRADNDGDMKIDVNEGHILALRLKVQLAPHGIDLDADRFEEVLREDNDIGHVLKFCAEVLYPEVTTQNIHEEGLSIFEADEEDDDFFTSGGDAERPLLGSFAQFCTKLSAMTDDQLEKEVSRVGMSTEDKMSMFSIKDKYCKGSVQVARGNRMSIVPGAQGRKKRYSRTSNLVVEAHKRSSNADKRRTRGKKSF